MTMRSEYSSRSLPSNTEYSSRIPVLSFRMGATHHKSHNVPAHASPNYVTVVMGGTRP